MDVYQLSSSPPGLVEGDAEAVQAAAGGCFEGGRDGGTRASDERPPSIAKGTYR